MPDSIPDLDSRVAAVRRFTRFYTRQLGVLQEGLLKTPFSLTELRVLYELANREAPTASDVGRRSRARCRLSQPDPPTVRGQGLFRRKPRRRTDGRQIHLRLTPEGTRAFAPLDRGSHDQVAAMLENFLWTARKSSSARWARSSG